MAIFLVTPLADNYTAIKETLEQQSLDFLELQSAMGFLVYDTGTSFELSNKLGITNQETGRGVLGSALVTLVGSYYGMGNTYMWEWIKSRLERST